MKLEKVFPVFAAAFAVIYLLAVEQNWALFTLPSETRYSGDWLGAAGQNGAAYVLVVWLADDVDVRRDLGELDSAWPLLRNRPVQFWLGWTVPLLIIVVFVYFFRDFFLR